jgi:class 3 adenylate cyclase
VVGIAVHLAARVQAAARPGEVLTSGTVKDLVVGSGLQFQERGSHVLKGVPGEWPLDAVTGDAERPREKAAASAGGHDNRPFGLRRRWLSSCRRACSKPAAA